jgi:hypothetical protein
VNEVMRQSFLSLMQGSGVPMARVKWNIRDVPMPEIRRDPEFDYIPQKRVKVTRAEVLKLRESIINDWKGARILTPKINHGSN